MKIVSIGESIQKIASKVYDTKYFMYASNFMA